MIELTPSDFKEMLDNEGNIGFDELSEEQKALLVFADMIKQTNGASAGIRCYLCDGTGWQKNSPYECPACHGSGRQ